MFYEYIYLGRYPQTYVTDRKLIEELNKLKSKNSKGYYKFDGEEYVKIVASPGFCSEEICRVNKGDIAWFKVKEIEWYKIYEDNENRIFVTAFLLDIKQFNKSLLNTTKYSGSELRNYLINGFYNKSFTNEEKNKIIPNEKVYNDKIWLLSKNDIKNKNYAITDGLLMSASPTPYAAAKGAYYNYISGGGLWWLCTDNYSKGTAYVLSPTGKFLEALKSNKYCIRPAIILKKE